MGGCVAFKLALRCPEKFAASASLSGVLDLVHRYSSIDASKAAVLDGVFGSRADLEAGPDDLMFLAEELVRSNEPRPRLFQYRGVEDALYQNNQRFREHAESLGLDIRYEEDSGDHEWRYWDSVIPRVLEWLPLSGRPR